MPGTPPTTTPDLLPRIGDADSPDIPRDMNALADQTQVALNGIHLYLDQLDLKGFRLEATMGVVFTDASGLASFTFRKPFASLPVIVHSHGDAPQASGPLTLRALTTTSVSFGVNPAWGPNLPVRISFIAVGPSTVVAAAGVNGVEEFGPVIDHEVDSDNHGLEPLG